MAIIVQARVRLTGDPRTVMDDLRGRIWLKTIEKSDPEDDRRDFSVISSRWAGGRVMIHVLPEEPLDQGFQRVDADLKDVCFSTLTLQQAAQPDRRPHMPRAVALFGYRLHTLNKLSQPGEEMTLAFDLTVATRGFENSSSDTSIVESGTFFNNRQYFPSFGHDDGGELQDPNERRKHGLPPVHRMAKVDDLFARRSTSIANDADWINNETVVSTSADPAFCSSLSARSEVLRDSWNGVAIEVYYHTPHGFSASRMVAAIKASLACYTTNLGPYQHHQVRIVELPRYARFARSFPNPIPFSESIGFIARLKEDDKNAIDYPFHVTAHEVAPQWWAHQTSGGKVQGCTMLSESFSQYSALMVMEKEHARRRCGGS